MYIHPPLTKDHSVLHKFQMPLEKIFLIIFIFWSTLKGDIQYEPIVDYQLELDWADLVMVVS